MHAGDPAAGASPPPEPTWAILIATLGQRRELFERLLDVLLPQLDPFVGRVRVLAWWNNGDPPLAHIRQGLVEATTTDYLSFVDDDDLVADNFVREVMRALRSWPDKVGWQTQLYVDGKPSKVGYHDLRYGGWYSDRDGMYRDVTHITPVRTDLAKQVDFRLAGPGEPEDKAWVRQIRPLLRTEVRIHKVMYHYLFDYSVSAWRSPGQISGGPFTPARPDSPYFAYLQEVPAGGPS